MVTGLGEEGALKFVKAKMKDNAKILIWRRAYLCQTRKKPLLPPVPVGKKNSGEGYYNCPVVDDYNGILVENLIAMSIR